MALRDAAADLVAVLEAAGLGSTTSSPPTLYAGRFPGAAPDAIIAVLFSGGESPTDYLGSGTTLYPPECSVLVRGNRGAFGEAEDKARAAWQALYNATAESYLWVRSQGSGPVNLGPDENGRHQFSFTVRLMYSEATAAP